MRRSVSSLKMPRASGGAILTEVVMLKIFWADRRGATAIEYALIALLVTVAVIGAIRAFMDQMSVMYEYIRAAIMG